MSFVDLPFTRIQMDDINDSSILGSFDKNVVAKWVSPSKAAERFAPNLRTSGPEHLLQEIRKETVEAPGNHLCLLFANFMAAEI